MDPVTLIGVLVGPITLSPVVEEVLFRGVLLGSLINRGWSPAIAGLLVILIFASLHSWLGVAGVVGIGAMAVFPTLLRLRFNNLTGATVQHFFNNIYAYTSVRGAEVFHVSGNDCGGRQGLTWTRVDQESWTFRVWGNRSLGRMCRC